MWTLLRVSWWSFSAGPHSPAICAPLLLLSLCVSIVLGCVLCAVCSRELCSSLGNCRLLSRTPGHPVWTLFQGPDLTHGAQWGGVMENGESQFAHTHTCTHGDISVLGGIVLQQVNHHIVPRLRLDICTYDHQQALRWLHKHEHYGKSAKYSEGITH